jgi:hypothetical protein
MKKKILVTAITLGTTFALHAQEPYVIKEHILFKDDILMYVVEDPCKPSTEENTTTSSAFYFNKPIKTPAFIPPHYGKNIEFRIDNLSFCGAKPGNIEFKVDNRTTLSIRGEDGRIYIPSSSLVFGKSWGEGFNRIAIIQYGPHGYIDYKDNLHFRADKNWISALTLYGNGSVGVGFGTTYKEGQYLNMGYKLAVNGGIVCEEVKVVTDVPDADYVFEEDYNLATLSEVETFIKENKHLPNIPSAQEFKENGYKVGEMDGMLLRKVEELTLYIIGQEKQMNEQQKLIEELQKRLSELEAKKGGE